MSVIAFSPIEASVMLHDNKQIIRLRAALLSTASLQKGDVLSFHGLSKATIEAEKRVDFYGAHYNLVLAEPANAHILCDVINERMAKNWPLPFLRPDGSVLECSLYPTLKAA